MKKPLLASAAAAALLVSVAGVSAQSPGEKGDAAGPAKSESGSPSKAESAAPKAERTAPSRGTETRPAPGAGAAQNNALPSGGASAQKDSPPAMQRSEGRDSARPGAASTDAKTENNKSENKSAAPGGAASNDSMKPSAPTGAATNSSAPSGSRTAALAPPPEKRTQIVSTIKQEKVEAVKNVNFNISIGAVVPTSVRFHPLPRRIVEIYPEWSGFEFIFVDGRYIIIRPQTHEIVYIIEG